MCESRLRPGEGLHYAWLHAEAGQPLSDPVAAQILLPVPQSRGVERRGRVQGKSVCVCVCVLVYLLSVFMLSVYTV